MGWMLGVEDFFSFWNLKTWTFGWLLRIVTTGLSIVLIGKLIGSEAYLHYLVIGSIVISGSFGALFAVMAATWSRLDGTYPFLVIAPSNAIPVVFGRTIVWLFQGVVTSFAVFIIYYFMFDLHFSLTQIAYVIVGIIVSYISIYTFGFFLGVVVSRWPSLRSVVGNSVASLLALFCGATVPLSFWPESIRWIIYELPAVHALEAIRAILSGDTHINIAYAFGKELLVAIFWGTSAALIFEYMINAGRADGSIEME